jgi:hypothetical protein
MRPRSLQELREEGKSRQPQGHGAGRVVQVHPDVFSCKAGRSRTRCWAPWGQGQVHFSG